MAALALRNEERIGLAVAIAAHAGLVALLLWHPRGAPVLAPPERIEVTISDEVGLTSTAPRPAAEAAPDVAPQIGEAAPPAPAAEPAPPAKAEAAPVPRPEPKPEPKPQPAPKPLPRTQPAPARPAPAPVPKPAPRPAPKPVARPAPAPAPRSVPVQRSAPAPRAAARPATPAKPVARPATAAAARPSGKPATTTSGGASATAARPTTRPGGSRVGADFLSGVSGARSNTAARNAAPAAAIGPAVRSAIGSAISRQLKPHWVAPQGADAELLVTIVRFRLAQDGSLIGTPEVVSQSGETAGNAAQKARHAEQAIRAVRLAAPFNLPDEYYSAWQTVTSRFDKRLSQ